MTKYLNPISSLAVLLALPALVSSVPAEAHHSFAEFDFNKPLRIVGVVSEVKWRNPHAGFAVDVQGPGGSVVTWQIELGSPSTLLYLGWSRDMLKRGDPVTVSGFVARDGRKFMTGKAIVLANGKALQATSVQRNN